MSTAATVLSGITAAVEPANEYLDGIRRAREFYRYLQPDNLISPVQRRKNSGFQQHHDHVPSLNRTLAPFCQLTALRCNAPKVMLNVMDRDMMYFLAEAKQEVRMDQGQEVRDFVEDPILMSCTATSLKGRICEMTITTKHVDGSNTGSAFVVDDLKDSQWADLSIVTGPPYYRFYAGVPISTRNEINIGSLAFMDTKPRPGGLSESELDFLNDTADQIMTYLEINRQAIEGRRSRRMAHGLEAFIAGGKTIEDASADNLSSVSGMRGARYGLSSPINDGEGQVGHSQSVTTSESEAETLGATSETEPPRAGSEAEDDSRSYSKTFTRAANLLRECMGDLGEDGCVAFVSIRSRPRGVHGHSGQSSPKRASAQAVVAETTGRAASLTSDVRSPARRFTGHVIATSTRPAPFGTGQSAFIRDMGLDDGVLRDLVSRYPNGHLWSLEETGASSSEEDQHEPPTGRAGEHLHRKTRRRKDELQAIRANFPGARQVLFTPLWDAAAGVFSHGVFVATALETRSFTSRTELSFLNSFCSTVMAECSRLEALIADKQKSDFVAVVSHELRSPLHGILASAEFIAETQVDGFQRSLVETIDSCGRTLLDTINHVLDFSKVNTFQKQWQASNKRNAGHRQDNFLQPNNTGRSDVEGAPPLLQLFGVINLSTVCEEVVDGLLLGQTFQVPIELTDSTRESRGTGYSRRGKPEPVEVFLDVQQADWSFMTQPGAVRRIIMNIIGNALKYTSAGSIDISLRLNQGLEGGEVNESLVFSVTDTGKGISPEFLTTKLFVPFAQENPLAPGTGLGLSIVRSIVLMLGGVIDVKSTVGKGTTVAVTLPVKRPLPGQLSTQTTPSSGDTVASGSSINEEAITLLQNQASDVTVVHYHTGADHHVRRSEILQQYVQKWYHMDFLDSALLDSASVAIVGEDDLETLMKRLVGTPGRRPALIVICSVAARHSAGRVKSLEDRIGGPVEFVSKPCGPYKLARSLRLVLEKQRILHPRFPQVTDLGSLAEEDTNLSPLSSPLARTTAELQEMDLGGGGDPDLKQLVHANEVMAVSQASKNAQMAVHDPVIIPLTPRGHAVENDEFPFPEQAARSPGAPRVQHASGIDQVPARHLSNGKQKNLSGGPQRNTLPGEELATAVKPRVLLVDDNQINLRLLETFLRSKRKYKHTARAEDGQQAVDLATRDDARFDIIFMDISMPVMNGFDATRAIRSHEELHNIKPGAMIIALTGLASGRDQSEGFDSGCDIYMTKPVSFNAVGKLLDNWEKHQRAGRAHHDFGPSDSQSASA